MTNILHKELSYEVTGLLFKVHKELGRSRSERQYSDYFERLLKDSKLKYEREYRFEDQSYGQDKIRCVCDFVIDDKIILEFKVKDYITKDDYYQTQRYLTTLNLELAIIINFRQKRLAPKRVLNSRFVNYNSD